MTRVVAATLATMLLATQSQAANPQPKFEVASIKRCVAAQGSYGGTVSAGRDRNPNCFSVEEI